MRIVPALVCGALVALFSPAARAEVVQDGSVTAEVTATRVTLANSVAERRWDRASVRSTIVDKRGTNRTWSKDAPDFALQIAGQEISSAAMRISAATVSHLARGSLRVTMTLVDDTLPTLTVTRVAEAYPGVAGFRTETTVASSVPVLLSAATVDEATVGASVTPAISAFRAGSDWRDPSWTGPPFALGDPHGGTWRETRTAAAGTALRAPGEWLSAREGAPALCEVMPQESHAKRSPSGRSSHSPGERPVITRARPGFEKGTLPASRNLWRHHEQHAADHQRRDGAVRCRDGPDEARGHEAAGRRLRPRQGVLRALGVAARHRVQARRSPSGAAVHAAGLAHFGPVR